MMEIILPGMMTSIQDNGRYGYQAKGVSVSGAMDILAYRVANILVGNEENAPCIEMAYAGPTIEFRQSMEIALTGGEFEPMLNGQPVAMYETLYVQAGDILVCGYAKSGIYGYLSFSAHLNRAKVLNSYATDIKAGIGGLDGRYLKTGDQIKLKHKKSLFYLKKRVCPYDFRFPYKEIEEIRFTKGIEYSRFSPAKSSDNKVILEVTPVCSRMGYRLKGANLKPSSEEDIISEGLSQGTIQGTNSGEWIVMMSDRQSVGGYPRVGHVISIDLVKLVHQRPKSKVYFKEVSVEEAQEAYRKLFTEVKNWKESLGNREKTPLSKCHQFSIKVNQKQYRVEVSTYEEDNDVL